MSHWLRVLFSPWLFSNANIHSLQVSILLQKLDDKAVVSPPGNAWLSPRSTETTQRTPSESSENESSAESSLAEEEEEGWESGKMFDYKEKGRRNSSRSCFYKM